MFLKISSNFFDSPLWKCQKHIPGLIPSGPRSRRALSRDSRIAKGMVPWRISAKQTQPLFFLLFWASQHCFYCVVLLHHVIDFH